MVKETVNKDLRLTDITHYDDVETGQLVLTVGSRQKNWKAIWLSNLRYGSSGNRSLPRTVLPLYLRVNQHYIECPYLKLNHRTAMWMVPLETSEWTNIGVDLYLCDKQELITPLPDQDYRQLVEAIKRFGISELSVEEPQQVISQNLLNHHEEADFDADFWNE